MATGRNYLKIIHRNILIMTHTYNFALKKIKIKTISLFRAVAHQVYGNDDLHLTIRESCMVKKNTFF